MKKTRIILYALCLVILSLSLTMGTASAAIIPFNGTEYSWLHLNYKGEPTGDWKSQIDDNIAVRQGDSMQFQNRWYNSLPGTADLRISYGGGQPYVCTGADEHVFYGLNYGNYYPGSTASVPLYSTVSNCSEEPNNLIINHLYVYNGLPYGSCVETDKWTTRFHEASPEEQAVIQANFPEQQENSTADATPPATATPDATAQATLSPGFGFGSMAMLICLLTMAYAIARISKKGWK